MPRPEPLSVSPKGEMRVMVLPQRRALRNSAGGVQQGRAAPASPRPHPNPLPAGEGAGACPLSVSPRGREVCGAGLIGFDGLWWLLGGPSSQSSPVGRRGKTSPAPPMLARGRLCKGLQGERLMVLALRRALRNLAGGVQQGRAAPASPRPHPNPLPAGEGVRPRAASLSQGQRAAFFLRLGESWGERGRGMIWAIDRRE